MEEVDENDSESDFEIPMHQKAAFEKALKKTDAMVLRGYVLPDFSHIGVLCALRVRVQVEDPLPSSPAIPRLGCMCDCEALTEFSCMLGALSSGSWPEDDDPRRGKQGTGHSCGRQGRIGSFNSLRSMETVQYSGAARSFIDCAYVLAS
jgi:hypothetical protein